MRLFIQVIGLWIFTRKDWKRGKDSLMGEGMLTDEKKNLFLC